MKKKKNSIVIIVILLVGMGTFLLKEQVVRFYYYVTLPNLTIDTPNFSKIKDGSYNSEYDGHFVSAKVTVVTKNHQISEVFLNEHNHPRGNKAEIIPDKIVKVQSLDIDIVAGATQSSNVIRKAIENALENALENDEPIT